MTELNLGDKLKVGDTVILGDFKLSLFEIGDFALARHRNVTIMLPTVYDRNFRRKGDFGFTRKVYRG